MVQLGHKDQNPNSILYTETSYHASGTFKEAILCHTRHEGAHTSKIICHRCTKVKHVFTKTYVCHLGHEQYATFNTKSNFLCSHGFFKVEHNTKEQQG